MKWLVCWSLLVLWQGAVPLCAGKGDRVRANGTSGGVILSAKHFLGSSSSVSGSIGRSQVSGASAVLLPEYWRFCADDNPLFALPEYNDSSWDTCSTILMMTPATQKMWTGKSNDGKSGKGNIGWFRLHITIDSGLHYQTVALLLYQRGASEVYINGRKLYSLGRVSSNPALEERFAISTPIPLQFGSETHYVLAVRYSNTVAATMASRYGSFGTVAGFECVLKPLEQAVWDMQAAHTMAVGNLIALGVVSGLTLLHLLFFSVLPTAACAFVLQFLYGYSCYTLLGGLCRKYAV